MSRPGPASSTLRARVHQSRRGSTRGCCTDGRRFAHEACSRHRLIRAGCGVPAWTPECRRARPLRHRAHDPRGRRALPGRRRPDALLLPADRAEPGALGGRRAAAPLHQVRRPAGKRLGRPAPLPRHPRAAARPDRRAREGADQEAAWGQARRRAAAARGEGGAGQGERELPGGLRGALVNRRGGLHPLADHLRPRSLDPGQPGGGGRDARPEGRDPALGLPQRRDLRRLGEPGGGVRGAWCAATTPPSAPR